MASNGRPPDPEVLLSHQIVEALKFVNWTKNEAQGFVNDGATARVLREFASDCYALALRNMSDHLLAQKPPPPRRG